MAIEINHLFESNVPDGDDDNLVQPSDWNANHVLSGGGVFRVPQLIEEKTLPAGTTSVTFSGLDGDSDREYFLEGTNINMVTPGSDNVLNLKPNNIATNQYTEINWIRNGSIFGYTVTSLALMHMTYNETLYGYFKAYLQAKTGIQRLLWSNSEYYSANYFNTAVIGGKWNDTSTNITSLVIEISAGSFSGTIRLYKMVDLNLGGE